MAQAGQSHFPETVKRMFQLTLLWPKTESEITIFRFFKVMAIYSIILWFGTYSVFSMSVIFWLHLEFNLNEMAVLLFEGLFFYYLFITFNFQLKKIYRYIDQLQNFDKFGPPPTLTAFKNEHNKKIKYLFWSGVVATWTYILVFYLYKKSCEEKKLSNKQSCAFVLPVWVPYDLLDNSCIYWTLFLAQLIFSLTCMLAAIVGTFFHITAVDLITIRVGHLNSVLLTIPQLEGFSRKKAKFNWAVRYHRHIIQLTNWHNHAFGVCNAAHYSLSSIIIGVLNYQFLTEFDVKAFLHLSGWLYVLIIVCKNGQKLRDESTQTSVILYLLNWYEMEVPLQKSLRIMLMRSQSILYIKAGILSCYSYELLKMILEASYTYTTMLNQLNTIQQNQQSGNHKWKRVG